MSRNGSVELDWADGTYTFALKIGQLVELQEKADAGPLTLAKRLVDGSWKAGDAREVLRLGLIGAGRTPLDALSLVRRYVDDRPLIENVTPAIAVLHAAIFGPPDEVPVKKAQAPEAAPETSSSSSPQSTQAE